LFSPDQTNQKKPKLTTIRLQQAEEIPDETENFGSDRDDLSSQNSSSLPTDLSKPTP
jgi:hypothetical protein